MKSRIVLCLFKFGPRCDQSDLESQCKIIFSQDARFCDSCRFLRRLSWSGTEQIWSNSSGRMSLSCFAEGQNSKRQKQVTTAFDVFFYPGFLRKEKKSLWLSKEVPRGLRTNYNTRKRSDKSCYQYIVDRYVNFISMLFLFFFLAKTQWPLLVNPRTALCIDILQNMSLV